MLDDQLLDQAIRAVEILPSFVKIHEWFMELRELRKEVMEYRIICEKCPMRSSSKPNYGGRK